MDRSDSEEESSDIQDSNLSPSHLSRENSYIVANQNTQASFLQDVNQIKKVLSTQFTQNIKLLVTQLKVDKSKYLDSFVSYLGKKGKDIKIQILKNDSFDIECIPVFVLVDTKTISLNQLSKALKDQNFAAKISINIDPKKLTYNNYIIFQPNQQAPFYFRIKQLPAYDKIKEADVLIDKFFEFYLNTVEGFYDFAAYMFHWVDARRILSHQFIPISGMKIILILFLSIINVPNLIQEYLKRYKQNLQKVDDYIEIGPRGTKIAKKEQINNFPNALLEQRTGFFLKSQGKYDISYQIRKIPFPIIQTEMNEMKEKFREESSKIFKSKSLGEWVYHFFKFAKSMVTVKKTLKINLTSKDRRIWTSQESEVPTLIILHPVFEYNITEHLSRNKDKQDFETICKEFARAFQFAQTGEMVDLANITDHYLD